MRRQTLENYYYFVRKKLLPMEICIVFIGFNDQFAYTKKILKKTFYIQLYIPNSEDTP